MKALILTIVTLTSSLSLANKHSGEYLCTSASRSFVFSDDKLTISPDGYVYSRILTELGIQNGSTDQYGVINHSTVDRRSTNGVKVRSTSKITQRTVWDEYENHSVTVSHRAYKDDVIKEKLTVLTLEYNYDTKELDFTFDNINMQIFGSCVKQ